MTMGMVTNTASCLGVRTQESLSSHRAGMRRVIPLTPKNETKANNPKCEPDMEIIWTVPVVIKSSRTSGWISFCSPTIIPKNNPRAGCRSVEMAAWRT